jgi:hypothetical protein
VAESEAVLLYMGNQNGAKTAFPFFVDLNFKFSMGLSSFELMWMNVRVHVFVAGRVQGVFFRQTTKRQAQNRGVTGWIRNL